MKHLMKKLAMVALIVVVAAAGYMAYQRYQSNHHEDNVRIQSYTKCTNNSQCGSNGYCNFGICG
jgi:uncharacterized membrane protein YebE (DUF533 family)